MPEWAEMGSELWAKWDIKYFIISNFYSRDDLNILWAEWRVLG